MTQARLYATDLDGTLLTHQRDFDRTRLGRVLDHLAQEGSYLAVATGNQLPTIKKYMGELDGRPNLYYIAENGALIHNQGRDLKVWGYSPQLLDQTLTVLEDFPQLGVILSCRQNSYVPADRLKVLADFTKAYLEMGGQAIPGYDPADPISAVRPFYPGIQEIQDPRQVKEQVLKVAANTNSLSKAKTLVAELAGRLPEGVAATSSGFGAIDLIIEGNHKGHALSWLAQELGVNQAQTVAFGDSGNDLEMFQYAARSYAMEESDPKLVAVATGRIGSNQEGAVISFLEEELGLN